MIQEIKASFDNRRDLKTYLFIGHSRR